MSEMITNPILPGFHPDPSICRRGDDYYVANSTFQWWPGVAISHSRDLVHWELVSYALTRRSQLDMLRIPDSGGIWAPCLTWCEADGLFYLIYTNVNRHSPRSPIETPNYLVTAPDVRGPWSEPVYLNRTGFDPSLFHDDDGRAWLVNMFIDGRPGRKNFFAGVLLQEYSKAERRLVGPVKNIWEGTSLGATEGPHLYRRGEYYYLIVAEGGTGYHHAMCMARSRDVWGPYEQHPDNPIMTAWEIDGPIQKAGHGDIVETPAGEWYGTFLCGRPRNGRLCVLGRETSIERGSWGDDGWFRFDSPNPREQVPAPKTAGGGALEYTDGAVPYGLASWRDEFDSAELALPWNTLRVPAEETRGLTGRPGITLFERRGWLRLRGQPLPLETDEPQALVARRVEDRDYAVETLMEYMPAEPVWQAAGLICWYSHTNYYWLAVAADERDGLVVDLFKRYGAELMREGRFVVNSGALRDNRFHLRAKARNDRLQFAASLDGRTWHDVGADQDGNILSDESSAQFGFAFTGAYVGVAAVDLSGAEMPADFDWFRYSRLQAS